MGIWQTQEITAVSVGAISGKISSNPMRICLWFQSDGTSQYFVSTRPIDATNPGFRVDNGGQLFEIDYYKHGELARVDWYFSASGPGNLQILQLFYMPTGKGSADGTQKPS